MKDDKLEKDFEEYFKSVNTPDDITADAKKYVKPKNKFMPKFVKLACVAASFVLVFAVALTVILKSGFKAEPSEDGFTLYTDADLSAENANPYSLSSLNPSLKFIENFALAGNAAVEALEVNYKENALALVKASVSVLHGLSRDDTEIFVEFTDNKTVYGGLEDYFEGSAYSYRGIEYYLTEGIAANGEPEYKLLINYGGVKYYFAVISSAEKAYRKYLEIILK